MPLASKEADCVTSVTLLDALENWDVIVNCSSTGAFGPYKRGG